MDPITTFKQAYAQQLQQTAERIPSACCLSTTGLDAYPNSRIVSFKGIREDQMIITGPLYSRKGSEIDKNPKVSLVFWWHETEKQIRIQGIARTIDAAWADLYFDARNTEAKIISHISRQGETLADEAAFNASFSLRKKEVGNSPITRPEHWGGWQIRPVRMEFMTFRSSRFHERELYQLSETGWEFTKLQPYYLGRSKGYCLLFKE